MDEFIDNPCMNDFMVTFQPQSYINDYATDIDGKYEFDATDKMLELSLEEIRTLKPSSYSADQLSIDTKHSGPFEVLFEVDAVQKFFEQFGYNQKDLTEEQLHRVKWLRTL